MWLVLGSDSEAPLFALRTVYHFPAGLGTGIFGRLGGGNGSSLFFIQAYWNLETTKTTFKHNIILRAHLEHSES